MTGIQLMIFGIFLLGSSTFGCRQQSFKPVGMQNLDMSRYHGKWYLIETGPFNAQNETENFSSCIYEEYSTSNNPYIYNWTYSAMRQGQQILDTGIVTVPIPSESDLHFFVDQDVFHSKILATDYESWTIEYSCNYENADNFERFMIRSRQPSLHATVVGVLRQIIAGYGVNVDSFFKVDQQFCPAHLK